MDRGIRTLDRVERSRNRSAAAQLLRARLYVLSGDLDEALRRAQRALELSGNPSQPLARLQSLRTLGELSLQTGNPKNAENYLDEALTLVGQFNAPYELALTQVAQMELQQKISDLKQDSSMLADARAIAERLEAQPLLDRINAREAGSPQTEETPESGHTRAYAATN